MVPKSRIESVAISSLSPEVTMLRRSRKLLGLLLILTGTTYGQVNGNLQIHFIDVGQGDGAILISPQGETVLFDDGRLGACEKPVNYLRSIAVSKIDYHIASHYH